MYAALILSLLLATSSAAAELELRFELQSRHQAMLLTATIDGRPATLLVDTGAGATYVRAGLAGVNEAAIARARFRTDVGTDVAHVRRTVTLGLGAWSQELRVGAANLSSLSQRFGRPVDGVLGQDVLGQFSRVTIDFRRKMLILAR
jgi:gag-polyprotein putative aspartyl protease